MHLFGQFLEFPVCHAAEEFAESVLMGREHRDKLEVAAAERQRDRLGAVGLRVAHPSVGMHERRLGT